MTPTLVIISVIALIFSVVAHEVAHGYMAQRLGDPTARLAGRLTINPLKHLDPIGSFVVPLFSIMLFKFPFGWARPVPYNPYNLRDQRWGEAKVAIAGPATNLLIALIFAFVARATVGLLIPDATEILVTIVDVNLALMVFNLVPVPPLDGFKVFTSFISARHSKYVHMMERHGFILVIVFVLFLSQFISPIIDVLHSLLLRGM